MAKSEPSLGQALPRCETVTLIADQPFSFLRSISATLVLPTPLCAPDTVIIFINFLFPIPSSGYRKSSGRPNRHIFLSHNNGRIYLCRISYSAQERHRYFFL